MATNIPPHNLNEIGKAILKVIDTPDCTNDDLIRLVPGPDFPTGGIINGREGIREAYRTGKGHIQVRAKAVVEHMRNGKEAIVVNEIPYQVNKSNLLEKIADLVRDKKIEGITRSCATNPTATGCGLSSNCKRDVPDRYRAQPALPAHDDADDLLGDHARSGQRRAETR